MIEPIDEFEAEFEKELPDNLPGFTIEPEPLSEYLLKNSTINPMKDPYSRKHAKELKQKEALGKAIEYAPITEKAYDGSRTRGLQALFDPLQHPPVTITAENIKLVILGEPKAQKRHRHFKVGTFIKTYDPSKSDKGDFLSIVQYNAPKEPINGPVRLDATFYFSRPKSHFRTGKNSHILKGDAPIWHTTKPDRDNLDKFCMDSLSKIYFKDDCYVCAGEILKYYSDNPRTEIVITKL
jgi:Holliday junction resolvase RusA-like endonuclease